VGSDNNRSPSTLKRKEPAREEKYINIPERKKKLKRGQILRHSDKVLKGKEFADRKKANPPKKVDLREGRVSQLGE